MLKISNFDKGASAGQEGGGGGSPTLHKYVFVEGMKAQVGYRQLRAGLEEGTRERLASECVCQVGKGEALRVHPPTGNGAAMSSLLILDVGADTRKG